MKASGQSVTTLDEAILPSPLQRVAWVKTKVKGERGRNWVIKCVHFNTK